jgi:hypothetical protein
MAQPPRRPMPAPERRQQAERGRRLLITAAGLVTSWAGGRFVPNAVPACQRLPYLAFGCRRVQLLCGLASTATVSQ